MAAAFCRPEQKLTAKLVVPQGPRRRSARLHPETATQSDEVSDLGLAMVNGQCPRCGKASASATFVTMSLDSACSNHMHT